MVDFSRIGEGRRIDGFKPIHIRLIQVAILGPMMCFLLPGELGVLAFDQIVGIIGGVGVVLHGLLEHILHHLRPEHVVQPRTTLLLLGLTNGMHVHLVFTTLLPPRTQVL